jgi:hypothetical protein
VRRIFQRRRHGANVIRSIKVEWKILQSLKLLQNDILAASDEIDSLLIPQDVKPLSRDVIGAGLSGRFIARSTAVQTGTLEQRFAHHVIRDVIGGRRTDRTEFHRRISDQILVLCNTQFVARIKAFVRDADSIYSRPVLAIQITYKPVTMMTFELAVLRRYICKSQDDVAAFTPANKQLLLEKRNGIPPAHWQQFAVHNTFLSDKSVALRRRSCHKQK